MKVSIEAEVVSRLRKSKRTSDARYRADGLKDGIEWAKYRAEVDDLERLTSLTEEELSVVESGGALIFTMNPELLDQEINKLLGSMVQSADVDYLMKNDAFRDGFIQGALQVWEIARAQL